MEESTYHAFDIKELKEELESQKKKNLNIIREQLMTLMKN